MAYGQQAGSEIGGALASLIPIPGASYLGRLAGGYVGNRFDQRGARNQQMQQMGGQPQMGNQGRESGFKQFFTGAPSGFEQVSPYAQQQQQLINQLGPQALQQFQNPYQGFEPIAQRAMTQFNRQELPSLYERLNAFGENAATSPTFSSQANLAQTDLAERLAALQAQYGLQSQGQALQLLQLGLTPQFQNQWSEGTPGFNQGFGKFLQNIAPAIGQAGIQGLAGYAANRPGASQGSQNFWNAISSSINGQRGEVN